MKNNGGKVLKIDANATITENLLTTCGNKTYDDKKIIKALGLDIK